MLAFALRFQLVPVVAFKGLGQRAQIVAAVTVLYGVDGLVDAAPKRIDAGEIENAAQQDDPCDSVSGDFILGDGSGELAHRYLPWWKDVSMAVSGVGWRTRGEGRDRSRRNAEAGPRGPRRRGHPRAPRGKAASGKPGIRHRLPGAVRHP